MKDLIKQYSGYDEESRLIKDYSTQIEFDTTISVLSKYLKSKKNIAELGAGTGRYSLYYAYSGHKVIAVEIVSEYVKKMQEKAKKQKIELQIFEGNATKVNFIQSQSQDLVLVLGPLYHLQKLSERKAVLNEAKRILKPHGIIAVAYINKYFVAGRFAQLYPDLIQGKNLQELLEKGTVSSELSEPFYKIGYFSSPDEMEGLVCSIGFSKKEHIAVDGISRYISEGVNNLNEKQYQAWLNYHLKICNEKTLLGYSNHGLLIGRKV